MPRSIRRWVAPIVAVVLAAATACSGVRDVSAPQRAATPVAAGCPRSDQELPRTDGRGAWIEAGRLPAGFRPVRAVECSWDTVPVDAEQYRVELRERRSPAVTTAVLSSLDLPDQEFTPLSHEACSLVGHSPSYLILVDAGDRAFIPRLPQDPCGEPRAEVAEAIRTLPLQEATIHRFMAEYR